MSEIEQRGSSRLAIKAGTWYVISSFVGKGLAFITTPIFARIMSEADYGNFSNFASWQSILCIIIGMELYNTLNRAYYDYTEDYDKYISSITIMSMIIAMIVFGVFLLFQGFIYKITAIPPEFICILFISAIFHSCKEIYLARERVFYRYKAVAVLSLLNLVIPTLISIALVFAVRDGNLLGIRIYGFYVPAALIGAACALTIFAKDRAFCLNHCTYAIKLSIPLLVHYLTTYLLASTNIIVTRAVMGAEATAVVSITTSAVHILTILLQALSGAVMTWLMDNLEQKNFETVRRGLLWYVGGISILALGVMMLTPEIVLLLGGKQYISATLLLPGMILASAIQAITSLFIIILTYQKRVVSTAIFTAIIAMFSIIAKVFLMPIWGLNILAWINVVAFAILFVCEYFLVKCRGEHGCVIDLKGFLACITIMLLVALCCTFLYQHNMIRWGIIVVVMLVFAVIAYKHRAVIKKVLKRNKK